MAQDPSLDQGGTTSEMANEAIGIPSSQTRQAQAHQKDAVSAQRPEPGQLTFETKSSAPLRRGKWTLEEEEYAKRLIHEFKAGLLPLTDGTTLRTFLSRLLNCDPMRISKKFVGSNCIGKQVFRRRYADVNKLTPKDIERTRLELCELERMFLDRLSHNSVKGRGNGSGVPSKNSRDVSRMSSLGGGGLGGMSNKNKSAAALGRAMLQGGNTVRGVDSRMNGTGGLLAPMQSLNQTMFPNNPAMSFLSMGSQPGGLGET